MDDLLLISEVFRFPNKKHHWQMKFLRPRVYLFNWQKKKILKKIVVPPAYFDREEYRFLRLCYHYSGARGIASNRKYVFIALQNTILVYDTGLREQTARIDHELFNGIHEIYWYKDRLYVTCAVTDSVLVMSEDGRELNKFYLGNNKYFLDRFNLTARELDNRLDYRIMHRIRRLYHINSVQVIGEDIYVNFNRQGSFVKIFPREEIIIRDEKLKHSHNAQFSPTGRYILINDTGNYALRVFDSKGTPLNKIELRKFPLPINFSSQMTFGQHHEIKAGWLRGLAFSRKNEEIVYLGLSPAMVVAVNYISGKFIDYFQFRKNIRISTHGLHNVLGNHRTA
jgi:hypothetical protein